MNKKILLNLLCLFSLLIFNKANQIQANLRSLAEEITLYTLDDAYLTKISLSSNQKSSYQFPSGENAKYTIKSGTSIVVNKYGTVSPKNTTWYWYGGMGTTAAPGEGQTPTRIEIRYTLGESTVDVVENGSTKTYNFKVVNYAEVYAEKVIDDYIANNVTKLKTTKEKYDTIAAFPAQYAYSPSYQSYVNMVIFEGGDCWASSNTIIHLCQKVGIKAHLRFAANDAGSGSGHRNVAALIDGKVYIAEAGYGYTNPNRPHHISEENTGFCYRVLDSKAKTAKFAQYDGFSENIKLPEKINDYRIIEIGDQAFYYGEQYSGVTVKSVELPDSIQKIGNASFYGLKSIESITIPKNVSYIGFRTFADCPKLKEIKVASDNKYFSVDQSVLYNYDKTKLINFFTGKGGEYEYAASDVLTEIDDYAFYYSQNVSKLLLPKTLKKIGEGAFGDSSLKEIYFYGPQPTIDTFAFADINVTVYYPKNEKWNTAAINTQRAKKVNFVQWEPPSRYSYVDETKSSSAWIVVLVIIILIALGVGGYLYYKKRKNGSISSTSVENKMNYGPIIQ